MTTDRVSTKHNKHKAKVTLITPRFMAAMARVLTLGNIKYPPPEWDWRRCNSPSDYMDAAFRHMIAWQSGENIDKGTKESPGTGECHLINAACCLMIVFELWLRGIDDREFKDQTAPPLSIVPPRRVVVVEVEDADFRKSMEIANPHWNCKNASET